MLIRLEEKDATLGELAALVKTDPTYASRHSTILWEAEVVIERFVEFKRSSRMIFCLTQIGQQLLQGMREVASQTVRTQSTNLVISLAIGVSAETFRTREN